MYSTVRRPPRLAILARQAAALGSSLLTPGYDGSAQPSQPRDALRRTCQHLRMLGSIQAANLGEPLRADERDLIRAIPVNITPPRRLPDADEPLTMLCEGVIGAAERLRHSARYAATRSPRSPSLNAESLRHAAAASMVTSHHCAVLLRALVGDAADRTQMSMERAVGAAELSRSRWLAVAQQFDQVTSAMKGYITADATSNSVESNQYFDAICNRTRARKAKHRKYFCVLQPQSSSELPF